MTAIRSLIDTRSDAFRRNTERMAERLAQVQALQGKVVTESESKRDKFEKKASCYRASAWRACSTGAAASWNSAHWPGWACTTTMARRRCSAAAPSSALARWRASAC